MQRSWSLTIAAIRTGTDELAEEMIERLYHEAREQGRGEVAEANRQTIDLAVEHGRRQAAEAIAAMVLRYSTVNDRLMLTATDIAERIDQGDWRPYIKAIP
jgi:hypothetical protein